MEITVRLFAVLRERAGSDSVSLQLADDATVADALEALAGRPELAEPLGRMPVRMAVNRDYADAETRLFPADELALVPPVSGGASAREQLDAAGDQEVRITEHPLSIETATRFVSRPGAGAIVAFEGVTREVESLRYEAYAEMALERISAILSECRASHGLEAAAAAHRVGEVPLSEPSVVVAVSAAHREQAFAGAREVIDRIKAEVPIWKQEVSRGKPRWVAGAPAPEARSQGAAP